ncbi:MAG TPA: hypothetical protein VEL31_09665 [Ktedonobacteraceae bacterium]|nr:hypothetical protein [Ktedonobacteraceae bacterium]
MTTNIAVQYVEYRKLECRDAINPTAPEEVEGTLLVGTRPALEFESNYSQYGNDYVKIFPAFHNGQRAWLERAVWCPAYGYSASGTQEYILSFEAGMKLFLERGVFEFKQAE